MAVFLLLFAPRAVMGEQHRETGIIKAAKLNVRTRSSRSSLILMVLKMGDRVEILDYDDGWVKISHNGHAGFVRNREQYLHIFKDKKKKDLIKKSRKEANEIGSKDEIVRKIDAKKVEVQAYTQKEAEIINHLDEIEHALNKSRREAATFKKDLGIVDKKIGKISRETQNLTKEIDETEAYASKRLVSLYKLNMLGKIHLLASAESIYDMLSRKNAMERILEYDDRVLENYIEDKERLLTLLKDLNIQKNQRLSLKKELQNKIRVMSREKTKRSNLLTEIRDKKSLGLAAIEFLKQAAQALDQTIVTLHADKDNYLKTIKKNFLKYKGLLKMPVKGKIILFFGPYKNPKFNVVNFSSGIEIRATRGAPIRTVSSGQVLYASWFRGYGNMIIIDHGGNYYTVYAHADELLKSKGDHVEMSEVIGTVGDSAAMTGSGLYFEVRHHGKPMDPLEWLSKG